MLARSLTTRSCIPDAYLNIKHPGPKQRLHTRGNTPVGIERAYFTYPLYVQDKAPRSERPAACRRRLRAMKTAGGEAWWTFFSYREREETA